jgi:hypothetical protein
MMLSILQSFDLILDSMNRTDCSFYDLLIVVMPGKNERAVQNAIVEFITELWRYAVSVQSWSIMKKTWKLRYKINLAPQWTPDIVACINW